MNLCRWYSSSNCNSSRPGIDLVHMIRTVMKNGRTHDVMHDCERLTCEVGMREGLPVSLMGNKCDTGKICLCTCDT